ncbi:MAG: glycosyltransferase [Bacteroidetes bacterium]|nr:glycosyltransferase [Bacteroidota bacterium]
MKGNLLVLTYWSYRDALVQTYTLPYLRVMKQYCSGKIYLVTLEQPQLALSHAERETITAQLATEGIVPVFLTYQPFGTAAAAGWALKLARLWWLIITRGIKGIHTWCTPAGMIGVILARLTDRKLVADSFEPHAEPMVETGEWLPHSRAFRTLFTWEKKLAHRARAIIALTQSMKAYAVEKYGMPEKPYYVKPALIDFDKLPSFTSEAREEFRRKNQLQEKVVCVMAGKTGGLYYEEEVFAFFASCAGHWGKKFHAVLLSPVPESRLRELAQKAGFDTAQMTVRFVPHHDVYTWMNAADFAYNPCKPVPSRRHGTSIKNSEYWACGLPIVLAQDISDDSELIAEQQMGAVLREMNDAQYRQAIQLISQLLEQPEVLRLRIKDFALNTRNMTLAHTIYRDIYANH